MVFSLERFILDKSAIILTDTESNKAYYSKLFHIPSTKFKAIYLTVDKYFLKLAQKSASASNPYDPNKLNIFFYGTMLPLHGIDYIYKMAKSLQTKPEVHFTIIGKTKFRSIKTYIDKLKKLENVTYLEWVDYEKLPVYIRYADLCLGGPFGKTGQAQRVITGKTLQFLLLNKLTIIRNNQEVKNISTEFHRLIRLISY